ncbi:MAG: GIY-YIG nuclease family protein [Gammaproteobacteria bacterium]
MSTISLEQAIDHLSSNVAALLTSVPVPLGTANPPNGSGVDMFLVDGEIVYIGEAKGSKGLRDRLLSKHTSGDDNHACQRAFKDLLPDRVIRREYIKTTVFVRWLAIPDSARVSAVERLLIWLYKPAWNQK